MFLANDWPFAVQSATQNCFRADLIQDLGTRLIPSYYHDQSYSESESA